jgi:hypothetical protein
MPEQHEFFDYTGSRRGRLGLSRSFPPSLAPSASERVVLTSNRNRIVMKSSFDAFYANCAFVKSITYVFSSSL